ncbi:HD-GYP domain-containing protein [Zavarzinella formosa]|uniref:HD-GYP domain-containing protein n=1 Tax=Zavarzinella formosa TaxID=360055 RepID=UPI00037660D4|nr:HD domain-containing phosphohydrolase [Zavarzinella formosa]
MSPPSNTDSPLVLVIDDNHAVRRLLRHIMEREGHRVIEARDGAEGLTLLSERDPDLVLLDLDMPKMGGLEFCQLIKSQSRTRLVPVVIITGRSVEEARLHAWELGADDFLTKPFQNNEVVTRCNALLRVKKLVDQLDDAQAVLFAMARAVEAKSPHTHGHTERVTEYALALARKLGVSPADLDVLRVGAALHDLGKIGIPDEILNKPGKLTPEEYAIVKLHPVAGVRIVEPLKSVRQSLPMVRWHHERMDGGGYPDGIFGGSIPYLVRILSVADVYDALSSSRPYRPKLPTDQCLAILRKEAAGGGLDPELVDCFIAMLPELSAIADKGILLPAGN